MAEVRIDSTKVQTACNGLTDQSKTSCLDTMRRFDTQAETLCSDKRAGRKACYQTFFRGAASAHDTSGYSNYDSDYGKLKQVMLGETVKAFPPPESPPPADESAPASEPSVEADPEPPPPTTTPPPQPPESAEPALNPEDLEHRLIVIGALDAPTGGKGYRAGGLDSAGGMDAGFDSSDVHTSNVQAGARVEAVYALRLADNFCARVGVYNQLDVTKRDKPDGSSSGVIDSLGVLLGGSYLIQLGKGGWFLEPELMLQLGLVEESSALEIGRSGNYSFSRMGEDATWYPSVGLNPGLSFGRIFKPNSNGTRFAIGARVGYQFTFSATDQIIPKPHADSGEGGEDRWGIADRATVGLVFMWLFGGRRPAAAPAYSAPRRGQ